MAVLAVAASPMHAPVRRRRDQQLFRRRVPVIFPHWFHRTVSAAGLPCRTSASFQAGGNDRHGEIIDSRTAAPATTAIACRWRTATYVTRPGTKTGARGTTSSPNPPLRRRRKRPACSAALSPWRLPQSFTPFPRWHNGQTGCLHQDLWPVPRHGPPGPKRRPPRLGARLTGGMARPTTALNGTPRACPAGRQPELSDAEVKSASIMVAAVKVAAKLTAPAQQAVAKETPKQDPRPRTQGPGTQGRQPPRQSKPSRRAPRL
jgi:hypothetical protein